jgi:hypothetical protein
VWLLSYARASLRWGCASRCAWCGNARLQLAKATTDVPLQIDLMASCLKLATLSSDALLHQRGAVEKGPRVLQFPSGQR